MDRLKANEVVVVEWLDASFHEGLCNADDTRDHDRFILRTVGFLLHEDDEILTIAQDDVALDDRWRHIYHIPKVCIKREWRVQLSELPEKKNE